MSGTLGTSRFGSLIRHRGRGPVDVWDTCLAESDNFIAVPSKGALVPGWVLVLPKHHVFALAQLKAAEWAEVKVFVSELADKVAKKFGAITMFEHGAVSGDSVIACGVEHAHLHLVPLTFDLVDEVKENKGVLWDALPNWHSLEVMPVPSQDYLMASSPGGGTIFAKRPPNTSQYFRKIIAQRLDMQDLWDYRSHPFERNVMLTVSAIQT